MNCENVILVPVKSDQYPPSPISLPSQSKAVQNYISQVSADYPSHISMDKSVV